MHDDVYDVHIKYGLPNYCSPSQSADYFVVAQGRTGPPGNREISRWDPASGSLSGPRPYTRIYFIDNQLRHLTDRLGIQRTDDHVHGVSPSERMTVMYHIHPPAGFQSRDPEYRDYRRPNPAN